MNPKKGDTVELLRCEYYPKHKKHKFNGETGVIRLVEFGGFIKLTKSASCGCDEFHPNEYKIISKKEVKVKTKYKFLRLSGKTIKSDSGDLKWKVGEWVKVDNKLDICNVGLHCSKTVYDAFSFVQGEIVAKVEVRGKSIVEDNKECWSEMRIIEAKKWGKKDSLRLAIFSAELVLKNFEKEYPDDKRPREAIEAAKKVLFKDTAKNRAATRSAAESARSAAWSAWSAAESAWSAAESAAWSAWSAAESAAESARSAAESARSAAESARSAAEPAAEPAALKKIQKFMEEQYKDLEVVK